MRETLARIDEYDNRVIVAGSRTYADYQQFCHLMETVVEGELCGSTVFISGSASRGADAMVIAWCDQTQKPCIRMPADWDGLGRSAGFVRNLEMAKVATHLYAFYDGRSSGTKNMIQHAKRLNLIYKVFLFDLNTPTIANAATNRKQP